MQKFETKKTSHLALFAKFTFLGVLSISLAPTSNANVVGGIPQNFNPTTNGRGFVTVQSSEPLQTGHWNLGLFVDYAVNSLPIFDTDKLQNRTLYHDAILSSQIHLGLGLMKNWDLGVSLPSVLSQSISEEESYHGEFASSGMTAFSVNTKLRLHQGKRLGFAVIGSMDYNLLKNSPFAGEGAGPTFNIELALDYKAGSHLYALNLGHRFLSPGSTSEADLPLRPLRNQLIWSTAANFYLNRRSGVIFELFGSMPTESVPDESDRLESSAEALLGYKRFFNNKKLALHVGGATEVIHGYASPDWRLYAGINLTLGSKKKKKVVPPVKKKILNQGPLGPVKKTENVIVYDVLFAFNSDKIIFKGQNTSIFKLNKHLKQGPGFKKLIIEGHTDSIGSKAYNQNLSYRRANKIRQWLIKKYKISPTKIIAIGKGEKEPIATNKTAKGRQKNRRVEFKIFR